GLISHINYSSTSGTLTSGSPAILVKIDTRPARTAVDATTAQSTSEIIADAPIAAIADCATVLTALTPAAFAQFIQYSLFFIIIFPFRMIILFHAKVLLPVPG